MMTVTLIFQYDFIFLIVAQLFVFSALKNRTEGLIFSRTISSHCSLEIQLHTSVFLFVC